MKNLKNIFTIAILGNIHYLAKRINERFHPSVSTAYLCKSNHDYIEAKKKLLKYQNAGFDEYKSDTLHVTFIGL